jgi:hypothetical protein
MGVQLAVNYVWYGQTQELPRQILWNREPLPATKTAFGVERGSRSRQPGEPGKFWELWDRSECPGLKKYFARPAREVIIVQLAI